MSTDLKICGLQSAEMIKYVMACPVDLIGLVFAPSRRQVSAEQAGAWIRDIRRPGVNKPLFAGVFRDADRDQLKQVLAEAKLDVVQLHGDESPELCRWLKDTYAVQIMKVFAARSDMTASQVEEQFRPYAGLADMMMLDTYDPHVGGGTGQTFHWGSIPVYQQWAKREGIPLFIAGGLNEHNVSDLIRTYAPDGVDVSSGVETDGQKDQHKIAAFVERVKHA